MNELPKVGNLDCLTERSLHTEELSNLFNIVLSNDENKLSIQVAEQCLVSACLSDPENIKKIPLSFLPKFISNKALAFCLEAILKLAEAGKVVNPISVGLEFESKFKSSFVNELTQLENQSFSAKWVEHYCAVVIAAYKRREYSRLLNDALLKCAAGADLGMIDDNLNMSLAPLVHNWNEPSFISFRDAVEDLMEVRDKRAQGVGEVQMELGLPSLGAYIKSISTPNLLLIGGATSSGKTTLACNMVASITNSNPDMNVCFVSLEQDAEELAASFVAHLAQVPVHFIRDSKDWRQNSAKPDFLSKICSYINRDISFYTTKTMRAPDGISVTNFNNVKRHVFAHVKQYPHCKLVVLDHLHHFELSPSKNETYQLAAMANEIKSWGGQLGVAIILLAQLNRDATKDKFVKDASVPEMTINAFRGANAIAEASDFSLIITRNQEAAQLHVLKNRFGERDKRIILKFDGALATFSDAYTYREIPPHIPSTKQFDYLETLKN